MQCPRRSGVGAHELEGMLRGIRRVTLHCPSTLPYPPPNVKSRTARPHYLRPTSTTSAADQGFPGQDLRRGITPNRTGPDL